MVRVVADGALVEIASGSGIAFGRGTSVDGVELTLSDDHRLHRIAGRIDVAEDSWTLTNTGRWLRLVVIDLDGPGTDQVPPGESRTVPWRRVRVEVLVGSTVIGFEAEHRPERATSPAKPEPGDEDHPTVEPFQVDRTSGYYRALLALCEPRLLDPRSRQVPTDAQLAVRLNSLDLETRHLTAKAVERRLDYVRHALGLKHLSPSGSSAGLEVRDARQRLVDVALTSGLITVDDLGVLGSAPRPATAEQRTP